MLSQLNQPTGLMTRDEAAMRLGVSVHTLAAWAAKHKGPNYSRSGSQRGKVWYRASDLDAWLESRSVKPQG
jgi:hypothetical protein